jgi:Terminase RNaseH-like domain/Terminase large subunit, T4likevirus-type, N-terminal
MVIAGARRFNVVACGRRFGKTTLGIDRLLPPALSGRPVAWCAPTYRSLSESWDKVRAVCLPVLAQAKAQEHQLLLMTGGRVDMWSLEDIKAIDGIRGNAYACAVVDEAASVRHLPYAWEQVLRPTLTDFAGGAWFLSTPKSLNYFFRLFQKGRPGPGQEADWAAWQFPTAANSFLPGLAAEVEAARRDLPERVFAQEYEAKFLEQAGAIFRRVMEAVRAAPQAQAMPKHVYVIGADWAKHEDFTHFVVVDATLRAVVAADRFQQIDYALQLARLKVLCQRFRPAAVIAERNAVGDPLVEQLAREGLPVQPFLTTPASKRAIVDALALAFERGEIALMDDSVLIDQLLAYTAERLPSGLLRYGAPEGQHDDGVMALMFAWQGARQSAAREYVKAFNW